MDKVTYFDNREVTHKNRPLLLIVDDDKHSVNLLIRAFKRDFRVEVFSHPVEIFERRFNQAPKAILIDANIAQVDGVKTVQCLKNHPKTCEIPIISMTSDRAVGLSDLLIQEGSLSVLHKPLNLNAVVNELKDAFDKINNSVISEDQSVACGLCFSQPELKTNVKNAILRGLDGKKPVVYIGWIKGKSWEEKEIQQAIESGALTYLEIKPELLTAFENEQSVSEFFEDLATFTGEKTQDITFIFENFFSLLETLEVEQKSKIIRTFYKFAHTHFEKSEFFLTMSGDMKTDISMQHLASILVGRRSL